jgi:uncharacterized protein
MSRAIAAALSTAVLLACAARAQQPPAAELASFPKALVEIRNGATAHRFEVWVADTPARQAQGLMFVRELARERGMLFPQDPPRPASMWMKNTYIELDMVFVARGRIVKIAARTRPHSLTTVTSEIPVDAVLELRGGETARRRIRVGHEVRVAEAGIARKP